MPAPGEEAARDSADILYCGGCNPQIDRAAVAREVIEKAEADTTVFLSGCGRACASGHQLVVDAGAVVVAGELVDGVPTPAAEIAAAVAQTTARRLEE
jgi:hypothetical protein